MALFYLATFAAAIAAGTSLPSKASERGLSGVETLASMLLAGAIASLGIALVQWTGAFSLGIYAADLPPGARPFANVAQPNLLCSIFFLGLCGAALLHESSRLHSSTLALVASVLLAGMVMSGSRTGWLQLGVLASAVAALRDRAGLRLRPFHLLLSIAYFICATAAWPTINRALLLTGGRPVTDQIQGGVRGPYWAAMLDAISHKFWWGYGWLQSGSAQVEVALDHAPVLHQFEFSHNLVIELFLWAGVPMGAAIVALGATALCVQVKAIRKPQSFWLIAAVSGLLIHAMLEYPLHYAFFLMPCGVMIGAASATSPAGRTVSVHVGLARAWGVALLLLLVAVTADYIKAEENLRILRMETARIGITRVQSVAPNLWVLTQLESLLREARVDITPAMSEDELERLRNVAMRYPYASSLLRYAEALSLNGEDQAGRLMLRRLCSIHPAKTCVDAQARLASTVGMQMR